MLATEIQREASARVWPMASRELDAIAADAVPALSAALAAEAAVFMPKVSDRLVIESAEFQKHVHAHMTASLDARFAAAVAERGDALKARYPQFAANPARYDDLVKKLSVRSQQWAQGQLDTTFAQHIQVLQSINASVQALAGQSVEERAAGGDQSMDDMMMLFLEIMNTRLEGKG